MTLLIDDGGRVTESTPILFLKCGNLSHLQLEPLAADNTNNLVRPMMPCVKESSMHMALPWHMSNPITNVKCEIYIMVGYYRPEFH